MPPRTTFTACSDDPELAAIHANVRATMLRRGGLYGPYAEADCELGSRLYQLATANHRGAYLYGPPGTGKTYAACAAVRRYIVGGFAARKVTAAKLLEEIRDEFDGPDKHTALWRAQTLDLLALDDVGAERSTPWALETLTTLIDARAERWLPTIVTSNYRLGELRERWGGIEGARLVSRLAGACEVIQVTGEDRRMQGRLQA